MEQDYTSIHAVAWDVEGRLCLYMPVTYKNGFCLSLMPGMYAEFAYDGQERGFKDLDEFEGVDIYRWFCHRLVRISDQTKLPVLCPVNVPMQRAAVEQALFSRLLFGSQKDPLKPVLVQGERRTILRTGWGEGYLYRFREDPAQ